MQNLFRLLPPMDAVLTALGDDSSLAALPRAMVRDAVTAFLDGLRDDIRTGRLTEPAQLDHGLLFAQCARQVAARLGKRAVAVAGPREALEAVEKLDGTVLVCGSMYLLAALFADRPN